MSPCDNSGVSSADQHGDAEKRPTGGVPSSTGSASVPGPVPALPAEVVVAESALVVRRSPKYVNFMIVGAVAGALLALVLTLAFPANPEFGPAQVFGFLLLGGVTAGVAVSCLVAIILDRFIGRSATHVVADRLDTNSSSAFEAPDPGSDPQLFHENS